MKFYKYQSKKMTGDCQTEKERYKKRIYPHCFLRKVVIILNLNPKTEEEKFKEKSKFP